MNDKELWLSYKKEIPPTPCPDKRLLEKYREGTLSFMQQERIEEHLATCEDCLSFALSNKTRTRRPLLLFAASLLFAIFCIEGYLLGQKSVELAQQSVVEQNESGDIYDMIGAQL